MRERYEPGLASLYQDSSGGIYRYFTSPTVQRMVGPGGSDIYARITGKNRFVTDLKLPGWPATGEGIVFGLNPKKRYALASNVVETVAIQVLSIPDDVHVSRYYEAPSHVVLVLESTSEASPEKGTVKMRLADGFTGVLLNDELVTRSSRSGEPASFETRFPAHFVFLKDSGQALKYGEYAGDGSETGRYVLVDTGLDRGGMYVPQHRLSMRLPGEEESVPFTFVNYGRDAEASLDYLVRVPTAETSLRVYQYNRSDKYGDASIGRLYVNGRLRRAYDFGPQANPKWSDGMPTEEKTVRDTDFHS
jgi:hypothetical protein